MFKKNVKTEGALPQQQVTTLSIHPYDETNNYQQTQFQIFQTQSLIKQKYFQQENEKLKQSIEDLRKTISINKNIINQLLQGGTEQNLLDSVKSFISSSLWDYELRLDRLKQQREEVSAELLIKEQIIQDMKLQALSQEEMFMDQLDEFKDKLERKEYVIQYKEEVWSTFERELKKVIKKDSVLYQRIQSTTQILVENLNETKISNVVKENTRLQNDHRKTAEVIDIMIKECEQMVSSENEHLSKYSNYLGRSKMAQAPDAYGTPHEHLEVKINNLKRFVDQIRNKLSIIEDENLFLRGEFQRVSRSNIQMHKQNLCLLEKIRLYQESISQPTPLHQKSTKLNTNSMVTSSNNEFQTISSNFKEDALRNSLIHPEAIKTEIMRELKTKSLAQCSQFSIHLQPTTPKVNHDAYLASKISNIELNLNRLTNESPEYFKRQQKQQRRKQSKTGADRPLRLEDLDKNYVSDKSIIVDDDHDKENEEPNNDESDNSGVGEISAIKCELNHSPFLRDEDDLRDNSLDRNLF